MTDLKPLFSLVAISLWIASAWGQAAPGNCTQFSNANATAFATASAAGTCVGVDNVGTPTILKVPFSLSAASINNVVTVDGTVYALNASGLQSALQAVSTSGGGKVVLPSTAPGSAIPMGGTSLTIPSNVCLVGAGSGQTILQWTSNVNAIVIAKGTTHACVEELQLSFSSSASVSSSGIRIDGDAYCPDCVIANPCRSGGSGAIAKRLNGSWVCN